MTPTAAGGRSQAAAALADLRHVPFWLDRPAPADEPALTDRTTADLAVVGAGYTGLWAALLAKERNPGRDVVVLEARSAGWAASGRNGGFCAASLTHGLANGLERWPDEIATLERLGRENLDAIEKTVADQGIDCSWERTGELTVATAPWQAEQLQDLVRRGQALGAGLEWLTAAEVRDRVGSHTACARPACAPASGCTRTRRSSRSPPAAHAARARAARPAAWVAARCCSAPPTARSGPAGPCSPPMRSGRWSVACARSWSRCGTTRWSPPRSTPSSGRRSAGPTGTGWPTRATSSTTTGSPTTTASCGAATTRSTTTAAAPTTGWTGRRGLS